MDIERGSLTEGYLDPMAWLRDLLETCDFFVRKRLDADEEVLATGRCEDITTTANIASAGAGWTYVMVTTKRVRWIPGASNLRMEAQLDLDAISAVSEEFDRHRYAISFEHPQIERLHWTPRKDVPGAVSEPDWMVFTRTRFAFSHPDTRAAVTLRQELLRRGHTLRA